MHSCHTEYLVSYIISEYDQHHCILTRTSNNQIVSVTIYPLYDIHYVYKLSFFVTIRREVNLYPIPNASLYMTLIMLAGYIVYRNALVSYQ